jgi:hypothetical protein
MPQVFPTKARDAKNAKDLSYINHKIKRAGETPALPFAKALRVNSFGIHKNPGAAAYVALANRMATEFMQ